MNEQESAALAQFCADQYFAFDAHAWHKRSLYDHHASTVAAMYLSMTSWYGHEDELERIASDSRVLHTSGEAFRRVAQASTFDPEQFSKRVRFEIGLRRAGNDSVVPLAPSRPAQSARG